MNKKKLSMYLGLILVGIFSFLPYKMFVILADENEGITKGYIWNVWRAISLSISNIKKDGMEMCDYEIDLCVLDCIYLVVFAVLIIRLIALFVQLYRTKSDDYSSIARGFFSLLGMVLVLQLWFSMYARKYEDYGWGLQTYDGMIIPYIGFWGSLITLLVLLFLVRKEFRNVKIIDVILWLGIQLLWTAPFVIHSFISTLEEEDALKIEWAILSEFWSGMALAVKDFGHVDNFMFCVACVVIELGYLLFLFVNMRAGKHILFQGKVSSVRLIIPYILNIVLAVILIVYAKKTVDATFFSQKMPVYHITPVTIVIIFLSLCRIIRILIGYKKEKSM